MRQGSAWYRSLYWRISLSFVVFVIAILVVQAAMFRLILRRSAFGSPEQLPNAVAIRVAAEAGRQLTLDPATDIGRWLLENGSARGSSVYVLLKGKGALGNGEARLDEKIRRPLDDLLNETGDGGASPTFAGPPVGIAPIQAGGVFRGLVVVPMPAPDLYQTVGLIPAGTLVLIVATTLAAFVIFGPARRRLQALERAAEQIGVGDLGVRAPEHGGDEIAHVAAAFNRMAADLAGREVEVRNLDQVRRQMLADVSHELKTPLTAIRGYVESLRTSGHMYDLATRNRYFSILERETLRLDRIVRDLIELARLEAGAMPIDCRIFAVDRVFEHVIARHEVAATARHVTFHVRVEDNADQMFGDPHRIEQAVDNIVVNALRHLATGGTIQLGAAMKADSVQITVIDSGEGIPAEHLAHVFERFYKADSSRANSIGSGLGLSIVKAIVERHGGRVAVESRPGRTAFTLAFPRDSDAT